ncbi:S1 RNA-binding domain-containing protein [Candidatus Woesearchaeota archaeon]|nr:S1 RNA-binding domain-containing protein [Candidatus Woesearchaeota archaeon]
MYYRKTGLPEESDLVMCTVTKIQYSSVFVTIDDYNTSGMIHISEIAAGRIRNIRDYVKEGKKIVCKVLRVHEERGHVDLSLRRVGEGQRRNKVNEIKLEQNAESIIEYVAKHNKIEVRKLYEQVSKKLLDEYEYLHHAFIDVVEGHLDLSKVLTDKKISSQIEELVKQRFKPKVVEVSGELSLSTYDSDGITVIKSALTSAEEVENVHIKYLGGGKYKMNSSANDYKEAEQSLKEASAKALAIIQKHNGKGEFKKKESKK